MPNPAVFLSAFNSVIDSAGKLALTAINVDEQLTHYSVIDHSLRQRSNISPYSPVGDDGRSLVALVQRMTKDTAPFPDGLNLHSVLSSSKCISPENLGSIGAAILQYSKMTGVNYLELTKTILTGIHDGTMTQQNAQQNIKKLFVAGRVKNGFSNTELAPLLQNNIQGATGKHAYDNNVVFMQATRGSAATAETAAENVKKTFEKLSDSKVARELNSKFGIDVTLMSKEKGAETLFAKFESSFMSGKKKAGYAKQKEVYLEAKPEDQGKLVGGITELLGDSPLAKTIGDKAVLKTLITGMLSTDEMKETRTAIASPDENYTKAYANTHASYFTTQQNIANTNTVTGLMTLDTMAPLLMDAAKKTIEMAECMPEVASGVQQTLILLKALNDGGVGGGGVVHLSVTPA